MANCFRRYADSWPFNEAEAPQPRYSTRPFLSRSEIELPGSLTQQRDPSGHVQGITGRKLCVEQNRGGLVASRIEGAASSKTMAVDAMLRFRIIRVQLA